VTATDNRKRASTDQDDLPETARRIPSPPTLFHIFWLKKWLILGLWLSFAIPAGILLSIFDIPVSYSASTIMRFPNVVGAQTNVMRDIAITQRESIVSIFNSFQVLEATIKKLNLRMRIITPDVFQKKSFKSIRYQEDLGLGVYALKVDADGRNAILSYRPEGTKGEYAIFKGPLGAEYKISVNGLDLQLNENVIKDGFGLNVEMEFRPLEDVLEDLRDAMSTRSLGSNNLEIKLKDRDPFYVADMLNTLRVQFLEVYYGTTEVQDVGILVQMEKDLDLSKKKLDQSQQDVSDYYASHPELMRERNPQENGDNFVYIESRQELDQTDRRLKQLKSVAAAKPLNATADEKYFWAAEMIQTMVASAEPKAIIMRGSLADLNTKQTQYKTQLGPEHPKIAEVETQKEALYRQIEDVESALELRLEKEVNALKIKMVKAAPTHAMAVPVKVQLELERLNTVNTNNQQIYDRLLESYNRAKLVTGSEFFKVTVVDPARPAIYKPPNLKTRLLIAAAAVAVLSLTVPFLFMLWHIFFLKVWTKDDVSRLLRMKALGIIQFNPNTGANAPKEKPQLRRRKKGGDEIADEQSAPDLPKPTRPPDPLLLFYGSAYRIEDLEAFRIIREEAENFFRNGKSGKLCLMVTSTQPNEGKTLVTCNLAMTFARKGKRTLLVDADFRLGRVDKVFNMPGTTGLDELLSQTDMTDAQFMEAATLCFQPTMQRNLIVVPRKHSNPNAGEMVSSDRFKAFIRMARDQFDVVLIDTPPVMITPEPLSLAEVTDGVIYVCRSGNTSVSDSLEAVQILEERGVEVAAVLNGVRASPFIENRYQKYSYYYQVQPKAGEPSQ
jgi:capsular exopolysaccharide synthesis family protein